MNYIVSVWGNGISVGLNGDSEEIKQDANLANSLFGSKFYDNFYNGRINFKSIYKFYKFLLYKHALPHMMKKGCNLKTALKQVRTQVKDNPITFRNFMLDHRPINYGYKLGEYQDGDFGYEFED